jgi:outer membrane receptor protein involved in Fe transport
VDYSNLTIDYDLGWGAVVFASSQVETELYFDTSFFPLGFQLPFIETRHSVSLAATDMKTNELRLSSKFDGPLQLIAGVFSEDVEYVKVAIINRVGNDAEFQAHRDRPLDYEQLAFFGEMSYQFNDQWALTVGGRHFDYDRVDGAIDIPNGAGEYGSFTGDASRVEVEEIDASETGQIYKANLSFTPNDDTLLYAQYSEGFRLGKGQADPIGNCDIDNNGILDGTQAPISNLIKSDTSENYELGAKFKLLDNRLTLNAAVFRIDWTDISVTVQGSNAAGCNAFMFANLGEARSEGIEVEANYAVSSNLLLNLSASYLDARLTESPLLDVPDPQDELAFSPNNASLGLEYNFELGAYPAFVRTDVSYVEDYRTDIALTQATARGGDYVKVV